MTERCELCGKGDFSLPDEPRPTAIIVPSKDWKGNILEFPGVYPICPKCRQQVAVAERVYRASHDA
jgi:hypothetical protein